MLTPKKSALRIKIIIFPQNKLNDKLRRSVFPQHMAPSRDIIQVDHCMVMDAPIIPYTIDKTHPKGTTGA